MTTQLHPPFSYDNLSQVLYDAPPKIWAAGMVWYEEANAWCHNFPPFTVKQVAGVVAAFSRNTSWDLNLRHVAKYLRGEPVGHFKPCLFQAKAILDGAEPLDVLTGWKIRAFYANIANPDGDEVTIDRHAAALLAGMRTPDYVRIYKSASENRHLHRRCVEIYTRAAKERGLIVNQAQAIAWLHHRAKS